MKNIIALFATLIAAACAQLYDLEYEFDPYSLAYAYHPSTQTAPNTARP